MPQTLVPSMAVELYPPIAAIAQMPGLFVGAYVNDPPATRADLIENYGGREARRADSNEQGPNRNTSTPTGCSSDYFRTSADPA